jgi:hypothetical protein
MVSHLSATLGQWRAATAAAGRRSKWGMLLIISLLLLAANFASSTAATIPTISVTSVIPDESVTIQTHNFPANQTFTVRMGEMGTKGIGGQVVTTTASGAGGSFAVTYAIPDALKGRRQIAIRLESAAGYFSYNWFFNRPAAPPPAAPVYSGIPAFSIQAVETDETVTIVTRNFPPNETFAVTMGLMSSQGVGGTLVGTIESGDGGQATHTFTIPEGLHGQRRIAIRAQTGHVSPLKPYYAYNWFYNAPAAAPPVAPPPPSGSVGGGDPVYTGIPTFRICAVTRGDSVTILTNDFPANQTFKVTMGAMYTQGIGGTEVGTIESGAGGSARYTFTIPNTLAQAARISIRAQTAHADPYFAYNWFNNATTTVDLCP